MATVIATKGRHPPARSRRGESARVLRLVDGDRPERRSAPASGEMVPRPGLVERLLETAAVPLVLVVAPAGYGKTTLLADWSRADARPFAWMALHEADNDPARFEKDVSRALERVNEREPYVLVLDDVHVLRAAGSADVLRTLASRVPRGSQLVLASRGEPPFQVARLRAHRALVEMRARDLAMTAPEAAALLALAGLDLAEREVETLVAKTEGWPAGLYLAAVSLREQTDRHAAVDRFTGEDVVVAGYLRDEILGRLPRAAVTFLRHAAILDELSGPACDEILERTGSERVLAGLARSSAMLVPLDRNGGAYRCHALLAQLLRAELRRLEPGTERELHLRACDWHLAQGDADRAIDHAVAAGDLARAGELVWASVPGHVWRGRAAAVQRRLRRFTADQIESQPTLALALAHTHLAKGELGPAERWAAAAENAVLARAGGQDRDSLAAGVALLRAAAAREGLDQMLAEAGRAYEAEAEDSPWRALCCLLSGVAQHLSGDREAARRSLNEGVRRAAIAAPHVQALCLAQLALLAAEEDDWELAAGYAGRGRSQIEHYGLAAYPASALVFAASAMIRAQRGRVEAARDDMRQAWRLLRALYDFIPWHVAETRITLARASLRLGDLPRARQLLADASLSARRVPDADVLREWMGGAEEQAAAISTSAVLGPSTLTTAELRVLGFLPTHLSFREIAARLSVSANTVKTQAHAVYRKLDASSRSEAVAHASEVGLLEAAR